MTLPGNDGFLSRFRFTLHNLVGHPVMEVLHLVGLNRAAKWVHRHTLPRSLWGVGRLHMEVEAAEYFDIPIGWMTPKEYRSVKRIREDYLEAMRDNKA